MGTEYQRRNTRRRNPNTQKAFCFIKNYILFMLVFCIVLSSCIVYTLIFCECYYCSTSKNYHHHELWLLFVATLPLPIGHIFILFPFTYFFTLTLLNIQIIIHIYLSTPKLLFCDWKMKWTIKCKNCDAFHRHYVSQNRVARWICRNVSLLICLSHQTLVSFHWYDFYF